MLQGVEHGADLVVDGFDRRAVLALRLGDSLGRQTQVAV